MATHRRGISATQWSVGDLLRREGRSWPRLTPAARGIAVGSVLLASTVVAVSMAAEPEDLEAPAPQEPVPPAAPAPDEPAPLPEAAPPATGSGDGERTPPRAEESLDGPAVALVPAVPHLQVPRTPRLRSALPHLSDPATDAGPVDGEAIVADTLDPDVRTGSDDEGARGDSDDRDSDDRDSDDRDSDDRDSDDRGGSRHAWDGDERSSTAAWHNGSDRCDRDGDRAKSAKKSLNRSDSDRDEDRDKDDRDHEDRDKDGRDHEDRDKDGRDHEDRDKDDRDGAGGRHRLTETVDA